MAMIRVLTAGLLLVLAGCSQTNPLVRTQFNRDAGISGDLPYAPLRWEVMTCTINHNDHTVATVFGNTQAIAYARKNVSHQYPDGSVISKITWSQQHDSRWFGGNIPGKVLSVEFLEVQAPTNHSRIHLYTMYGGSPLKRLTSTEERVPIGRAAELLAQRAAVMP